MTKKYNVAVVGATGVVGQEIISILEERNFPVDKLLPLASERSAGSKIDFHDQRVKVELLTKDSFEGIDYALFSAGGSISAEYAPYAVKSGAIVIDNTSHFRMDKDVPLIVPEVNAHAIKDHKGIIANPNCSTAQLVVALKPLHDAAQIERVVISTYQSVSGAGKDAIIELEKQSRGSLAGQPTQAEVFPTEIAFNAIPQIDVFQENGYTKEEMKMILETKKILEDESIEVTATCVRVPVFISHSESVNVQTKKKLSAKDARTLFEKAEGVTVYDDTEKLVYPTPRMAAGKDDSFIGRIREDVSHPSAIDFWCVSDNLRKGAALNAVQIAEACTKQLARV